MAEGANTKAVYQLTIKSSRHWLTVSLNLSVHKEKNYIIPQVKIRQSPLAALADNIRRANFAKYLKSVQPS